MKGHVAGDHIHLFVSVPPSLTIRRLLQMLKGKSSYKLMHEFPHLRKKFRGRHLWARGYFCVSSGNVTDEVIKQYIAEQSHDQDSDFRVEGEGRRDHSGRIPNSESSTRLKAEASRLGRDHQVVGDDVGRAPTRADSAPA
jgi:hypothetical protein